MSHLSWDQRSYSQKAELILDNVPLSVEQRNEVMQEWGNNVYQNTPEERLRALSDLQNLASNKALSEADRQDMLRQQEEQRKANEEQIKQMMEKE